MGTSQADGKFGRIAFDRIDRLNGQRSALDTRGSVFIGSIWSVPDRSTFEIPSRREGESGAFGNGALGQIVDADLKVSIANSDVTDSRDGDVSCARDGLRGRRTKRHRPEIDRRGARERQVDRRTQAVEGSRSVSDIEPGVAKSRSLELVESVDLGKVDSLQEAISPWDSVPGSETRIWITHP